MKWKAGCPTEITALETRLTSLETRVDAIDKRLVVVETSLKANNQYIAAVLESREPITASSSTDYNSGHPQIG